jgi:hypothetical protein
VPDNTRERLAIGGLFRCCVATFQEERSDPPAPPEEGQTLTCKYCKKPTMIYTDGVWRWNRDAE